MILKTCILAASWTLCVCVCVCSGLGIWGAGNFYVESVESSDNDIPTWQWQWQWQICSGFDSSERGKEYMVSEEFVTSKEDALANFTALQAYRDQQIEDNAGCLPVQQPLAKFMSKGVLATVTEDPCALDDMDLEALYDQMFSFPRPNAVAHRVLPPVTLGRGAVALIWVRSVRPGQFVSVPLLLMPRVVWAGAGAGWGWGPNRSLKSVSNPRSHKAERQSGRSPSQHSYGNWSFGGQV